MIMQTFLYYSKITNIMDPANPFNAMYHSLFGGEAYDWENVVRKPNAGSVNPYFPVLNHQDSGESEL
jgi:hypothetical protein